MKGKAATFSIAGLYQQNLAMDIIPPLSPGLDYELVIHSLIVKKLIGKADHACFLVADLVKDTYSLNGIQHILDVPLQMFHVKATKKNDSCSFRFPHSANKMVLRNKIQFGVVVDDDNKPGDEDPKPPILTGAHIVIHFSIIEV